MSTTFLSAYLQEITSNLSNWHTDNYDFYRFGPAQRSWATPISDFFSRRHYLSCTLWPIEFVNAARLVKTHLARFESLFGLLADDESRNILVKLLAFRALGFHRVKLPLNTPHYWTAIKQMEGLADRSRSISANFLGWQLDQMDLTPIGIPVRLHCTPAGSYIQFVVEQYRCRGNGVDIAVEPDDIVIDAGACWGDATLGFACRAGTQGKVFCYEFVKENLDILRQNLSLNPDLSDRIHIIERAVWQESNVRMVIQGNGPSSRVRVVAENHPGFGPLTLTIDDLVLQNDLPRVDFIKMDIEGSEIPALCGAIKTIRLYKPKLAISVYHHLTDLFEVPELLDALDCGYRFYLRHYTIFAEETVLFAEAKPR